MILREKTELKSIQEMQPQFFEDMVKIVIDKRRKLVAVNMEMHADLGMELYDDGSDENDLYGANIYYADRAIEWSSTLNIKQNRKIQNGTYGRVITDEETICRLTDIIDLWIY
ncbi:MAG: hypothetical protein IJR00_05905 [Lachnospiraceae bacterium]|nr:hypothetical protein [Lachnospiraceae bacterium]